MRGIRSAQSSQTNRFCRFLGREPKSAPQAQRRFERRRRCADGGASKQRAQNNNARARFLIRSSLVSSMGNIFPAGENV
jgi:hypothetical protein